MFKDASKLKLRFKTVKGLVTIEDLWDIPLTSKNGFDLNTIAKEVYLGIEKDTELDFVGNTVAVNGEDTLKLDILKEIIKDKKEEISKKTEALISKAHNDAIDKLILEKEQENLKSLSIDELKALRK